VLINPTIGGIMTLKTKLISGLGFLFLIIFTLVGFCSYYVGRLGQESENILRANYDSLVYTRNMLSSLDDMKTSIPFEMPDTGRSGVISDYYMRLFDSGRKLFEANLKLENGNITEIREQEYVSELNGEYDSFLELCNQIKNGVAEKSAYVNDFLPAHERLKRLINAIYDVNIEAVVRKSQLARASSSKFTNSMAVIGTICILLTFAYLWYFPVYISTTMKYLSERMKKLLKSRGLTLDIKTNDEAIVILHGINLLENMLESGQSEKNN
jgi:two-component system, NtrC family, sensor histidine kinase KinB